MRVAVGIIVFFLAACAALIQALAGQTTAATPSQCVVPAKPGGGMDMTCKLTRAGLEAVMQKASTESSMQISYLPGGIGAVAWNSVVSQRRNEGNTLFAFSGGSLLNLALGKYGKSSPSDVRWVAALGSDYGMIAVRADSPIKSLQDLVAALRHNPAKVTIGGSGTIGSQDWLKMAMIAKQAGVDPKALRIVAFEGGGDALTALMAGHVDVISGDSSEVLQPAKSGEVRVLAVLSDARLTGVLANVPTAHEQGFDVTWPIIRGIYMGPEVSDADYRKWVERMDRMLASPAFEKMRAENGLYPFAMTGPALTEYVRKTVDRYGRQAKELGLIR